MNGLTIGPGFQQWITDHQATPESDEIWFTREQSMIIVRTSDVNGNDVRWQLIYNKLTNVIIPFVQAT